MLAVVGLGSLGGGIARRLAEKRPVVAFDVDRARLESLADGSGVTAVTAAEAWSQSVIVSLIPTSELLLPAIAESIAEGWLARGAVVVDMSTANPQLSTAISDMLNRHDVRYIAAPVMSGGPDEARAGTLRLAVGSAGAIDAAERGLIERIGDIVVETSTPRAAQLLKLSNNMIALVTSAVLAEAWTIATQDVSPADARRALASGTSARWVDMDRFSLADAVEANGPAGFSAALAAKDLRTFSAWASATGVPAPAAAAVATVYAAAIGAGKGAGDAGAWPWLVLRRPHTTSQTQEQE